MTARSAVHQRCPPIWIVVVLLIATVGPPAVSAGPFPTGDFTGDGNVDISDVMQALRAAVGLIQPTQEQLDRADVDGAGRMDAADALAILKIAVGLIPAGPVLPQPEVVPENQAIRSGAAAGPAGNRTLWGVADPAGGLTVADVSPTPVVYERVALTGYNPSTAEMVEIGGLLERDSTGSRIDSPRAIAQRAIALPDMERISSTVAGIDLGSISYPLYAAATTAVTTAAGWGAALDGVLGSAKPELIAASTDGASVMIAVRGPRLPPETGIVYRYPRVTVVFDSVRLRVMRLLVDIEGWVEE